MIYDLIGIGIGPFNLGLAALADNIPELNCFFADASESFNWHPGLMIPGTRLQVPFYADLVTLADPTSKFTYLNFLKSNQRLFRFAIHENYFPTRKEYNQYCQWAVSQLNNLQFNTTCTGIFHSSQRNCYGVQLRNNETRNTKCYWARNIVIGVGTVPALPKAAINHPMVLHSSQYLPNKEKLLQTENITIIGSGQSAAEIFNDLLGSGRSLSWFTRSTRFFPMEYSKLTLEMTSPDYIDHFYGLGKQQKRATLLSQDHLYKGINYALINEIYDRLYVMEIDDPGITKRIHIHPYCELKKMDSGLQLTIHHTELGRSFTHSTDAVILATGYKNIIPEFLQPLHDHILWDENKNYNVQQDYSIGKNIFVQNADLHTHGFNSADLGMGPYRNAIILNSILQKEHFKLEKNIAFQSFGIPHL